jgi:hypothetical protein
MPLFVLKGNWWSGITKNVYTDNVPIELVGMGSNLVEWKQFALEETKVRNGKVLKKLSLVYKKTTLDEMLDYLKLKLQHFVKHNFVVQWEDK